MTTRRLLHPLAQETRLVLANRLAAWRANPAETTLSAVAVLAIAALLLGYSVSRITAAVPAIALWLEGHGAPALVVIAVLAAWQARRAVQRLLQRMDRGWWAAVPVTEAARGRTAIACVAILLVPGLLLIVAVALLLALGAHRTLAWALRVTLLGALATIAGATVGGWLAYRARRRDPDDRARRHSAPPLLALGFLDRTRLPYAGTWQHRLAVRYWRSGGRLWPWLLLGVVVPANESLLTVFGLLGLGGAVLWLGNALRATHEIITGLAAALAAAPSPPAQTLRAVLRYPVFALAVAALVGAGALLLLRASPSMLALPGLLFSAYALLDLAVFWRHRHAPRRAGLRLILDLVVVIGALQVLPPLALLVHGALVFHHFHRARRET